MPPILKFSEVVLPLDTVGSSLPLEHKARTKVHYSFVTRVEHVLLYVRYRLVHIRPSHARESGSRRRSSRYVPRYLTPPHATSSKRKLLTAENVT